VHADWTELNACVPAALDELERESRPRRYAEPTSPATSLYHSPVHVQNVEMLSVLSGISESHELYAPAGGLNVYTQSIVWSDLTGSPVLYRHLIPLSTVW